ncbi:25751_t:CDS:2 [Gigaspora rosea]|nr:25751_t:CDS:2 [Gigaspora rosea]
MLFFDSPELSELSELSGLSDRGFKTNYFYYVGVLRVMPIIPKTQLTGTDNASITLRNNIY